MYERSLNIMLK